MFVALRRVHVAASDFSRSRRFYGETLGLPEIGGFEKDWVEFGLGPVLVKLTPLRPGEVPARNQVALTLSTADLEACLTALKERGVTVTRGPLEEFTGRSAEILDPDGYRIIVFHSSDLHPDEEYVRMSDVDEKVKEKIALLRAREKGKAPAPAKPAPVKAAPAKAAPKKPAPAKAAPKKPAPKRPVPKKAGKPTPKKAAKPAPKRPAPKKAKK
ncbi:MAG: VOC family protein [Holophagales bacterium]|nr:VOC family protein [Holophagales bacterium]